MNDKKSPRGIGLPIFLMLAFALVLVWLSFRPSGNEISYSNPEFQQDIEAGNVSSVQITQNKNVPTGSLTVSLKSDTSSVNRVLYVSDVNKAEEQLDKEGIPYYIADVKADSNFPSLLISGLSLVILVILLLSLMGRSGGANAQAMNFGKNRAKVVTRSDIKFKDVAGLTEEKESLAEIVDFLKNPSKYTSVGARIPKGVILMGPPGNGKTLLAKAVAGEAGVHFFTISGSDFVEMFVGVGASRVRELFADAKKHRPCIIFIDEIDAVARRRGTGMGGGHDEREQTLNQLLVEMDGFSPNEGIIVLAATNRVDILDPAILRPGRFDRKVAVGLPDVRGREEILKVHARTKPLADNVDLEQIARTTAGFTGADLENLLNEAAIYAARNGRPYVEQADIRRAFVKVGIGEEKKSKVISDKEKRITAYHEAGHAILFHVLPDVGPVYSVSIIPTGIGAAGYTMPLPERDVVFNTRGKMLQDITVSLGGRIAEELVFDDITTGASQDIKQATQTARSMVKRYGMSESMGLISYDDDSDEVVIGRDLAHARAYGEAVAAQIDNEVKNIIDSCYDKAKAIITEHRDVLDACAELLLEREKITREEFEALFGNDNSEEAAVEDKTASEESVNETAGEEPVVETVSEEAAAEEHAEEEPVVVDAFGDENE